ncbi:MAG: tail fiber domain-containing protein, partial [Candidatus Paceibacterota bacterium]
IEFWSDSYANSGAILFNTAFGAAYTEKMRIDKSGNVGIGTTAPSSKLDVNSGSGGTTEKVLNLSGGTTGGQYGLWSNTGGVMLWGIESSSANNLFHGSSAYSSVWGTNNSTSMHFSPNNNVAMTILNGGNVGIGTTGPAVKLDVEKSDGSGRQNIAYFLAGGNTNGNGSSITVGSTQTQAGYITGLQTASNEGDLIFGTQSAGAYSEKVRILGSTGNVGIGTTVPGEKLEVGGNIRINTNSTASSGEIDKIVFGKAHTSGGGYGYSMGEIRSFTNGGYSGGLNFYTGRSIGGGSYDSIFAMTINDVGNVGIGTTSPAGKLNIKDITRVEPDYGGIVLQSPTTAVGDKLGITFAQTDMASRPRAGIFAVSERTDGYASSLGFFTRLGIDGTTLANTDERMRITSSGTVGIGTTSPQAILHTVGGTGMTGGWNRSYEMEATYPTLAFNSNNVKWGGIAYDFSAGMRFWVNSASRDLTQPAQNVVSILNNGNMGIGTIAPTQKLEVVGDVLFSGASRTLYLGTAGQAWNKIQNLANDSIISTGSSSLQIQNNAGTSALATVLNSGNFGIGTTSPVRQLTIQGPDDTTVQLRLQGTGDSASYWELGRESASTGDFRLISNRTGTGIITALTIKDTTGAVRFNAYGAGTLSTDASGNITASSDERLKSIQGDFKTGLQAVLALNPILYKWNSTSGMEMNSTYAGFSAQNVQTVIPEAVDTDPRGYLSLQDRPIMAATVNAIKELNLKVEDLSSLDTTKATSLGSLITKFMGDISNNVTDLYASVIHSDKVETKMLCVGTTCVTEDQFLEIVNKSGVVTGGQGGGDQSGNLTPEQIEAARIAKIDTDLATIKTSAGALTEANYTAESWATFQTALTTALALPEDTEANKTDKTTAITSAIAGLQAIAQAPTLSDLTAYNAAINAKAEVDYTSESWITYKAVLDANVVTTANSQTEVDAATSNITTAQANLTPKSN